MVIWGFPARHGGTPLDGGFIYVYFMENPIEMDDFGVPPVYGNLHFLHFVR